LIVFRLAIWSFHRTKVFNEPKGYPQDQSYVQLHNDWILDRGGG
jgi:hypothetical protein